ncbi:MAG: formylglycine-generating enzyme family protein, partial [Planctomycetota bacterium]|nr:formylglycine-generating enzyme family protein [Planctomycetota bacterium]
DHERWRRASSEEQDRVIEGLIRRIRKPFKYLETKDYSCNGREYRIARFEHEKTGMKLHLLPGGDFYMGIPSVSNESAYHKRTEPRSNHEKYKSFLKKATPRHRVHLKPFLIAPYELLEDQWSVGSVGKTNPTPNRPKGRLNRPLVREWLEEFPTLRLLSEAEWEYAARAGTSTRYFWGDEYKGRYAWYALNSGGRLHLVTEHQEETNAFGLSDMIGNIWELVADDFRGSYQIPSTQKPYFHPTKPGQGSSIFRGGGYQNPPISASLSTRFNFGINEVDPSWGTRLAASFDKVFGPKK